MARSKKERSLLRQLFINCCARIGTNPIFGAVTAIVTVVTGCLASFYTAEIKAGIANYLPLPDPFPPWIFWGAVLITGLCLWAGLWGQAQKARDATGQLTDMVGRLEGLASSSEKLKAMVDDLGELPNTTQMMSKMVARLQTLPAEGYLPSYASYYRIASESAFPTILSKDLSVSEIEETIRIVLGSAIMSGIDYDEADEEEVVYSANLLLWRPGCADLETKTPTRLVAFGDHDSDVAGALELVPTLSTSSAAKVGEDWGCDPKAPELLIPIFKNLEPTPLEVKEGRYRVLPGAGWAFCFRGFFMYKDVPQLMDWLDKRVSATEHEEAEILDYFKSKAGASIKSFVSIPVFLPDWGGASFPIAVLNLNSNKENLVGDNGDTLFAPLLEPYLVLLSILLLMRQDALPRICGKIAVQLPLWDNET